MKEIWNKAKESVKQCVSNHSYRMWIEPLQLKKHDENSIVLTSPNFFSRKRVLDHFGSLIESKINQAAGKSCRFSIEVGKIKRLAGLGKANTMQLPLPEINLRPHNGRLFRKDFTFDQFVVGNNNDFAYSASLALASEKNKAQNSLFLLSGTGMGKSHLSQAIGHHILTSNPGERVCYITAEDFSNEMVSAYQHNCINKFKEKYRKQCDVLLLEDIHYIGGKERTQIELASILDILYEFGKKIIYSSCYLPSCIPKLNNKLRSRLTCGLISAIEPPDYKTRVRILQKKAKLNGGKIPEDVTRYLASELVEDVRQLESGLIGVTAKSSLLGVPIDLKLAESVVKNIVFTRKNITIDVIKKMVCKYYSISVDEIVSSSRKKSIVRPRQIAIYLSRRYTDAPLQKIGKSFNRYHATALHSIGSVEKKLKERGPLQRQVEFLSGKLESGKF